MANRLKTKLAAGEPALGCSLMFSSPQTVEMLGYAGFDWVLLDCEHGSLSPADIEVMAIAAAAAGITAIARPRTNSSSDIQTVDDLVAKLKADPGSVAWAGGSAGGVDHIAAGLIAKAVGVDPTQVNYIAYSGGGEALAAILGGQVTVGVSGVSEFASQIEAGELRLLAVSTDTRVPGFDAPTLKEAGVDVAVQNWRMVAAAPNITDEQKAAITADVKAMAESASWKTALETKGWVDTYLDGDAFAAQLEADKTATEAILKDIGLVQ